MICANSKPIVNGSGGLAIYNNYIYIADTYFLFSFLW